MLCTCSSSLIRAWRKLLAAGLNARARALARARVVEAGIYHFKARAYHPGLGRFLQTDPSGFAGGMNLYAYAGNDPINFRDPLGLDSQVTVPGCGPNSTYYVCRDPTMSLDDLERLEFFEWMAAMATPSNSEPPQGNLPTVTVGASRSSLQWFWRWWQGVTESYKNVDSGLTAEDDARLQSFHSIFARGSAIFVRADGTMRVGRVMSPKELAAMRASGRLVESWNNGVTSVSLPANPTTYRAGGSGDVYVEFDVPASAIGCCGRSYREDLWPGQFGRGFVRSY